jgi:hypothetical protein
MLWTGGRSKAGGIGTSFRANGAAIASAAIARKKESNRRFTLRRAGLFSGANLGALILTFSQGEKELLSMKRFSSTSQFRRREPDLQKTGDAFSLPLGETDAKRQ